MPTEMAFGVSKYEQIKELRRKIQLLDYKRTVCDEKTQATIKRNKESIQQLREENETLRIKLAETSCCDKQLLKEAFQKDWERKAYRNKSVKEVTEILEESVLFKRKCLNALKHSNETYRCRLKDLKMEYQRLKSERSRRDVSADAHALKNKESTNMWALKNNLEKTEFKCREAENAMTNYLKLKTQLQNESLTYQDQLDSLEAEIVKQREVLCSPQVMSDEGQLSKEAAKARLQEEEELLYKECNERERIIAGCWVKLKEVKAQAEKVSRRVQGTAVQPDELSSEAQHSTSTTEVAEEKMSSLVDTFKLLKRVARVKDIQEIVWCFNFQKEKTQQLEKEKEKNEEVLQLKEQKELLIQQFEEMKYSREAKLSSNQQALREVEQQLQAQQQRCGGAKVRLDWLLKTLCTAQDGIEHLADKLQHVSLSEDAVPEVHPDSFHFVLELMAQCEKKLESLHNELQGKDLAAIMKEMDKEKLYYRMEWKLPEYNTKVKRSEDLAYEPFYDEKESDGEEAHVRSRKALKRQSQLILDSNSKKIKKWRSTKMRNRSTVF